MAQQHVTPILAVTSREEDLELINRVLRKAGMTVHCQRVNTVADLADALRAKHPHLLFLFTAAAASEITAAAKISQEIVPILPLIAVSTTVDEKKISAAMHAGARDLVSFAQPERLLAVAQRELRAFRLEQSLRDTIVSANRYRRELKAIMAGNVEAIAYVQEGIIVNANPAWAELFGHADAEELVGLPLMDSFDAGSQAALKGALMACARKQWGEDLLRVVAIDAEGSTVAVELRLEEAAFGDEAAIRISVPQDQSQNDEPEQLVATAAHKDPVTGFYHRRQFIDQLEERLAEPLSGGVRALAYIRPDKFGEVKDEVGPLATEDVLIQAAGVIQNLTQPNDICGRFGGVVFTILIERGTLRDGEAWAENIVRVVSDHVFEIDGKTLSITCTLGLAEVTRGTNRVENLVRDAEEANKRGRQRGGDQVVLAEISDESTRIRRFDDLWVQRIKAALMDNRFRLVNLPIAHLNGKPKKMYDTVLRMVDELGDEVAATEFIQAAERNQLLKMLDRWVIGSAFAYCENHKQERILIKLSKDSITDSTLLDWISMQAKSATLQPGQVCFQVSEADAAQYLKPLKRLFAELQKLEYYTAIEHFGLGRNSLQLLEQLPLHIVKFDGSILQNIETNPPQQEAIKSFVTISHKREIETIAERVEQASAMAVLFQLGIDHMQGHYVHEPDVVLEDR